MIGVVAFLSVLLVTVQVLVGLHADTRVEAVTHDAARMLAEGADEPAARARVAELLGSDARVDIAVGADRVRIRVEVDGPVLALPVATPFTTISEEVELRREQRR